MTARTGDVIEQAARVLSDSWQNMHTNESLGRQRMLADALADAGLLARPLPTREEIDRVMDEADAKIGWVATGNYLHYADALLALLEGDKR